MSSHKPIRPPLTEEYLTKSGNPVIIQPADGILAIVSGDGYETVDMTERQFIELYVRMRMWIEVT